MGIVYITLPGPEQRAFANALHKATGGGVDLVIITKPRSQKAGRLRRVLTAVRSGAFLQEIFYGVLLRMSRKPREVLAYLRATSFSATSYDPPTLEVEDVNDAKTEARLKELAPELIVLWTGAILRPNILATAKKVINFHTGILPYYRGSVANQFAVLRRDTKRIGSTIHFVVAGGDRGDIIAQAYGDTTNPPREMFCELNAASLNLYIDIARKILAGEDVHRHAQDQKEGEFFALKDWTNRMRWKLGRQLVRWERTGKF